ncbi:MAG: acyl-CoA dehydrogenase family protein [Burkholderiaceae bacterium]
MSSLLRDLRLAALPPAAEALRSQVRAFLASELPLLPAHQRARSWMGFDAIFSRKLAARGWAGLTLPARWGGANLDAFARYVLVEELLVAGAPVSAHWIADRQSGPLILKFGSATQQAFYLPRICRAEIFFCIGMSEPNSGSDLASVSTRAESTATGWRLNGQKIWTTNAHHCQYMIALVRSSDGKGDGKTGLSQFIVDLSLPGVTVRPIRDLAGDAHFAEVFFDNVALGPDALVGTQGGGWAQVNAELAFERSGPERIYSSMALLELWISILRERQHKLAGAATIGRLLVHLAVLRNMSITVTARLAQGDSPLVEAALVKDLGTEFEQSIPAIVESCMTPDDDGPQQAELRRTLAYMSQMAPAFSLRGGTREILRGMIARGMGLR